ncbi:hypothetical protein LCI18_014812 [Fusarium solani-melongenae]|uniref:Uncharacterized protein n=1 Tax=Fusarium solani subsp. cucurbitae TaxID=2747967 RepID=A0ACD3ZRN7_FUSSC|nr:hypothetical protein LCI18_014812 [Fusarium solani-melongenae]
MGSKRRYFRETTTFTRPEISQPINLQDLVRQHEAKKNSRLDGVTFLNPHDDSKSTWIAGLVGFDNTYQLNTWLDRDELDANPGVLIRGHHFVPVQDLDTITHQQVDPNLSYIAILYRLLTSFPERFLEHPDNHNRKIWKFTHNNWQAALCVVRAFKKRRGLGLKSDRSPSESNNLNAVWFGSITEQNSVGLADMNSLAAEARNAVDDMNFATSHEGCGMGATESELATLASADEVIRRCPELARKYGITPGQGLEDVQLALGSMVNDCIVKVLSKLSRTPDISNDVFKRTDSRPIPMTQKQKRLLIASLLKHANVQNNDTGSASSTEASHGMASIANAAYWDIVIQVDHEMLARAEDQGEGEGEDSLGSEESDTDDDVETDEGMDEVRQSVQLMNTLSSEQQNLEFICQQIGITDWRDLRMECMALDAPAAKPRQIVGAWWIYQRLTSAPRAAILADQCGIGKTLQIGLALAIDCLRTEQAHVEGTRNIIPGDPHFKPSIIFCPGVVVGQVFREFRKWFGTFFKIRVAYGTEAFCPDPIMSGFMFRNAKEVRLWVNDCEMEHEDPRTMRKILLTSYTTAVFRMVCRDKSQLVNRKNLPQLVDDEENHGEESASRHDGRHVRLSIPNAQFDFVICDQGHLVKNPNSVTHKLIKTLHREALVIVSATPILNHVKDFDAYINLMWQHAWPFKYKTGSEPKPEVFYSNEAWEAVKRGDTWQNLALEHCINGNDDETLQNGTTSQRAQSLRAEYTAFVRSRQGPLFRLNPSLFQAFVKDMDDDGVVAEKGIKPLLEMLCLRRGMLSQLTLPDETIASPGDDMPPSSTRCIQLQHSPAESQRVSALINKHIDDLLIDSRDKYGKHIGHTIVRPKRRVLVNSAVLQALALLTTHPKFYLLTQANMQNTKLLSMMAARQLFEDKFKEKKPEEGNDRDREALKRLASDAASALAALVHGPEHVFGGVDECVFPRDRLDMAQMICHGSPKLAWTVQRVLELNDRRERVLIYVNHPLTLMILNALLTYLGVRSLHIRSSHPMAERTKAIRRFSNPNEDVGALITSFQLGGFGINLHGACHHGIIVEYPQNLSTLLHAIGRLWRLGQTRPVEWDLLYLRLSFDGYQMARMARKYAPIIVAEGYIPSEIQGKNRLICPYEIIAMHLGHSSSWYPKVNLPWQKMDDEDVERQGRFYSALARFMMADPSSSIKIRQEMTMDHVDGKIPPLENGVVLGSLGRAQDEEPEGAAGDDDVDGDGDEIEDDEIEVEEDEPEGSNDGNHSRDFGIVMAGSVVIDPQ